MEIYKVTVNHRERGRVEQIFHVLPECAAEDGAVCGGMSAKYELLENWKQTSKNTWQVVDEENDLTAYIVPINVYEGDVRVEVVPR